MPDSNSTPNSPLLNTAARSDTVVAVQPEPNVAPNNRSLLRDTAEPFFGLACMVLGVTSAVQQAVDDSPSKRSVIALDTTNAVCGLISSALAHNNMTRLIRVGVSMLGGAAGFALGYGFIAVAPQFNLHLDADSQEKILTGSTGLGYSVGNGFITANTMQPRF